MRTAHGSRVAFAAIAVLVASVMLAGCSLVVAGRAYGGRFYLYVLGADKDGVSVPALALECTTGGSATVQAHDVLLGVTIPGTSYTRLREAYPFGGGRAVTKALTSTSGVPDAPYVVMSAMDAAWLTGPVTVELSRPYNSYIDGTLYSFVEGEQVLEGEDVRALLYSFDYLSEADRQAATDALGAAIASGLAERDDVWAAIVTGPDVDTDLSGGGKEGLLKAAYAMPTAPRFEPVR